MLRRILLLTIILALVIYFPATSQTARKTVAIGYFEGGDYFSHKLMMREVRERLDTLNDDTLEIYFEPEAYKSAEWKRDICRAMAGDLARMKNIDMVIAAGPWVVYDLLEAGFDKPIIGIYQFDPEITGLVDKGGKPLIPNLTVNYSPGRLESDIVAIKEVFQPKKIGFLYFPVMDELDLMVDKVTAIAERHGIEVVSGEGYNQDGVFSFHHGFSIVSKAKPQVLYCPPLWGMQLDKIRQFFNQAHINRIRTFTTEGFVMLEKGALMSTSNRPYRPLARFTVDKIIKIIGGASPGDLPTVFTDIKQLCLNMNVARRLHFPVPLNKVDQAKTITPIPFELDARYTLDLALDQAARENYSLLAVEQTYTRAIAEAKRATATYYPRLRLNGGVAATDDDVDAATYNCLLNRRIFADLTLEQKVFSYPTIKAIQIARRNRDIEEINLQQARDDLRHTVILAYFAVLEAEDRLDLAEQRLDRQRDYREMAITNTILGISPLEDISFSEENYIRAKIDLYYARSELDIARSVFNVLLNRPSDQTFSVDDEDIDPGRMVGLIRRLEEYTDTEPKKNLFEKFLVSYAAQSSTDMRRRDLTIGRQKLSIARNRGFYYPEISLRAGYRWGDEFRGYRDERVDNWSIGGIVTVPVLEFLTRRQKNKSLAARLEQLRYEKDAARLELMGKVLTDAGRLYTLMRTLPLKYDLRRAAKSNLATAAGRYEWGRVDIDRVLQLEERKASYDREVIDERFAFYYTYLELLHRIGVGYLKIGTPEELEFYRQVDSFIKP